MRQTKLIESLLSVKCERADSQITPHHHCTTCTPDLFLQDTSQIFDACIRSGIDLLHPQQMCMYCFMSSLAITHKELVCQCCVCSFCALYSHSNEWRWLDYSVSVRLLGGLQRSSYRLSLIWLSESIWVLSFVRVMVGSCVTTALSPVLALHPLTGQFERWLAVCE